METFNRAFESVSSKAFLNLERQNKQLNGG